MAQDEERSTLAYKILSAPKTKKLMDADDVDELERFDIGEQHKIMILWSH